MPSNQSVRSVLSLIGNDPSKELGLTVGDHENVRPGQYIPRPDAQSPPKLFFAGLSSSSTYLVVGLDIDAPFPSFGILGPILHWIQPGIKSADASDLDTSRPFIANNIGLAPPPGSSPHRYVFLLYEQPVGFDAKTYAPPDGKGLSNWYRMRYDLDAWAKVINLGPILAFNYFTSN
ncbi:unnamed protein product [Penicillium salamii]|nr:unnamed protein product [Penicillium salamii]CAG8224305.1 unnamed protein product [Penicillium salamii]